MGWDGNRRIDGGLVDKESNGNENGVVHVILDGEFYKSACFNQAR